MYENPVLLSSTAAPAGTAARFEISSNTGTLGVAVLAGNTPLFSFKSFSAYSIAFLTDPSLAATYISFRPNETLSSPAVVTGSHTALSMVVTTSPLLLTKSQM